MVDVHRLYANSDCDLWQSKVDIARDALALSKAEHKVTVVRAILAAYCPAALPQLDSTPPQLAPEAISAALAPAAAAWAAKPNADTYKALATAAQAILDGGAPLGDLGNGWSATEVLKSLATYPGSDVAVYEMFTHLPPMEGVPTVLQDGNYTVGKDVQPGKYKTLGAVEGCYWETLDDTGEINDNNFVDAAPQVIASIRTSDFAFNSQRCGPWIKIG